MVKSGAATCRTRGDIGQASRLAVAPPSRGGSGSKDLLGFVHDLTVAWGLERALAPGGLRVRSSAVRVRQDDDADPQDFLNSFFAADLGRVAGVLRWRQPGAGLAAYLTPSEEVNSAWRVDLRGEPAEVLDAVVPSGAPLGRWPAEPAHPLALIDSGTASTGSGMRGRRPHRRDGPGHAVTPGSTANGAWPT
ncbi:hypothetical protein FH609_030325 [Streptomyces sp. 3MP-14]|uniref:Uncharacterized protein n=1 Tax=Streptomyces mimosae TaxID=2586635 RepID=A0A5N5ZPJ5_9ACTN|nr:MULTISPECIES: hypothetical protein [Streptomyces]KAB8157859.1 hypothetical protein FH607_029950 [Streptomyces mimosae]KAB8172312.1 hypothetical protein FH609_030325 [Streptomyces sp. 3MP-14]